MHTQSSGDLVVRQSHGSWIMTPNRPQKSYAEGVRRLRCVCSALIRLAIPHRQTSTQVFATRRIVFRAEEKIQATAGALKAPAGNPSESSLFFADANAHRNTNNLVGLPARRQVH